MRDLYNMLFFFFLLICSRVSSQSDSSIIIIGAGPAGIAAASKLLENNFTNLRIIEAEDRVGGRIKSLRFGEKFVDIGAEYCHGRDNNIIYELVKDMNVLEPMSKVFEPALYYSNSSRVEKNFAEEIQSAILEYDSQGINASKDTEEQFTKWYNATIIQKHSGDAQKLKILKEARRLAEKVSLMIDGAFSWHDTSAVTHYQRCGGHQLLVWKGRGFKTILEVLTKEFPHPEQKLPIDDKIHLNKQVSKIVWSGDEVLLQISNDKSTEYTADHVIFTPSVGVLKEQRELFAPSLPKEKLDAIEAIGIAGIMKIILHFEKEWWKEDDFLFSFLWSDEDLLDAVNEFPDGPAQDGISWVSAVTVMATVPGNPNILTAWVTGKLVSSIEQTSESVLKDGCMYILKKFLGRDYVVTEPDSILKSSWRSNSHFRGTYSFERAGFEQQNISYRDNLAQPLTNSKGTPVVLFAGEATNKIHYSTVHGAIETGFREAERIINLYRET